MAYEPALFLHLLSVFAFVSGIVVATVGTWLAPRGRTAAEIAAVARVSRVGAAVTGIGWLLVIVTGLILVGASDHDYEETWIALALGLVVLAGVVGGVGGRRAKQARVLAETGTDDLEAARALLRDRTALLLNATATLLVLVVLALMVWQPGA